MAFGIFDIRQVYSEGVVWGPVTTPTEHDFSISRGYGSIVSNVIVANSDSIGHVVGLVDWDGAVEILLGVATVPAGAGVGTGDSVDLVAAALPSTIVAIVLADGHDLRVKLGDTTGASGTVWVWVSGGAF